MHVLPSGFHRIRHYGLLASATRAANIARARALLAVPTSSEPPDSPEAPAADKPRMLPRPCSCCGGRIDHRDLRARLRAQCFEKPSAPPRAGADSDQDRHLMTPSPPIHHRTATRHSGRRPPGNAPACAARSDSPVVASPIQSRNISDRLPAHSSPHPHLCFDANDRPRRHAQTLPHRAPSPKML
jgi:hypothetical protein